MAERMVVCLCVCVCIIDAAMIPCVCVSFRLIRYMIVDNTNALKKNAIELKCGLVIARVCLPRSPLLYFASNVCIYIHSTPTPHAAAHHNPKSQCQTCRKRDSQIHRTYGAVRHARRYIVKVWRLLVSLSLVVCCTAYL